MVASAAVTAAGIPIAVISFFTLWVGYSARVDMMRGWGQRRDYFSDKYAEWIMVAGGVGLAAGVLMLIFG